MSLLSRAAKPFFRFSIYVKFQHFLPQIMLGVWTSPCSASLRMWTNSCAMGSLCLDFSRRNWMPCLPHSILNSTIRRSLCASALPFFGGWPIPFCRLRIILSHKSSVMIRLAKVNECVHVSLFGGSAVPLHCFRVISIEFIFVPNICFGLCMSLLGGKSPPFSPLSHCLLETPNPLSYMLASIYCALACPR